MYELDKDQIKSRYDLRDFVESDLGAPDFSNRIYSQWCCPFHGERTASFTVHADYFVCHGAGCGKKGDIFTYLMERDRIDFVAALKLLNGDNEVKLEKPRQKRLEREKKQKRIFTLGEIEMYHSRFSIVKDYVSSRKISDEVTQICRLGAESRTNRYVTTEGQILTFDYNRVAIPYIFANRVISLNWRRDDLSIQRSLAKHQPGIFDAVKLDIAQRKNRDVEQISDEHVRTALFGLRYQKPNVAGAIFGVDQLAYRENKKTYYRKLPYAIIDEGEFNAMAMRSLGFRALSLQNTGKFDLQRVFQNTRLVYIAKHNDEDKLNPNTGKWSNAGVDYAMGIFRKLGGDKDQVRIIEFPKPFKDADDMAIANQLFTFLSMRPFYLEPLLESKSGYNNKTEEGKD